MERAVDDLPVRGVVERVGQLAGDSNSLRGRRRTVLADDHVQRVGRGKVLRQERAVAGDAGRPRRRDDRMLQIGVDQLFEFADELMNAFRRKIELNKKKYPIEKAKGSARKYDEL